MIHWLALLISFAATADVLFVDLNDADQEVANCAASAGRENMVVVNAGSNGGKAVGAAAVERAIANAERAGRKLDTIVISGHDGNGEYFGGAAEQNSFRSSELREILNKYPSTQRNMKVAFGWGCYTGNVRGNETYWLNVSPNIVSTVGFPVQAPTKENRPSQQALRELCSAENREALGNASTKNPICQMYQNLPILKNIGASICNREAMATNMYNDDQNKSGCYYIDDLYKRCQTYDPENKQQAKYDRFFTAAPGDKGFTEPPLDGADVNAPAGNSPLRGVYNDVHLYKHCHDTLLKDRGYEMPSPASVIRLVKYRQVVDNVAHLNAAEMREYDERLADLGLQSYQIGDLSKPDEYGNKKDRAWLNARLNGATSRLKYKMDSGVRQNGTEATPVWMMANGLKVTLVDMRYRAQVSNAPKCAVTDPPRECFNVCSHFSLVHGGIWKEPSAINRKSQCVLSYEGAQRLLK